ncbi:MAG: tryptophan--tRNA ligase [Deltaproteobacteria bacterium]|nr:tryptophan--tRNA ligase [Deltaproteobacteria bacterium]
METRRKRSLSGIKPTGAPHLGNHLGMIRPAIALQDTHDAFYFVADWHALTTARDPKLLRQHTLELTATFLALGLDPTRSVFFRQSDVPEVQELAWLLSCVTNLGLLLRAHAYKAAEEKGEHNLLPAGTFYYPVLMASDILVYDADVVPVGRDQVQHIEMAQDMAGHFNAAFAPALRRPEPLVLEDVPTIPGTDGRKMSKSYQNAIDVFLPERALRKAVMGIKTDSTPVEDPKDPDKDTVFMLYRLYATPEETAAMDQRYRAGNYGYGHAKQALAEVLERDLGPARERYNALLARPAELDDVLRDGARRARAVAREVLDRARSACGLGAVAKAPTVSTKS